MNHLNFNIRWMLQKDVTRISKIENIYFKNPLSIIDISKKLDSNSIGLIVENDSGIIGFMIYDRFDRYYIISRICVTEYHQRSGFGTKLINSVKNILTDKINQMRSYVDANNLESQMFFKNCSFQALKSNRILDKEFIIFVYNKSYAKDV